MGVRQREEANLEDDGDGFEEEVHDAVDERH